MARQRLLCRSATRASRSEGEARNFLKAADKSPEDGKLSLGEVEAQLRVTWAEHEEGAREDLQEESAAIFRAADVDENGQLTPEELQNGWANNLYSERAKSMLAFAVHNSKVQSDEL